MVPFGVVFWWWAKDLMALRGRVGMVWWAEWTLGLMSFFDKGLEIPVLMGGAGDSVLL